MSGRKVIVHDGQAERALRKFKKQIADIGLLQELRERQEYVKPTIRKKIAKQQAKKRWQKYLRDQELPKKYF
jgi:small subunit ribosomal protein S21